MTTTDAKPAAALVPVNPAAATLQRMLADNHKAITSLLPAHIKPEMLMRTIFTSVTQTPKLLECTPVSILRATLQAAMLGLPPNDGRGLAYLVPFRKGKKEVECQLITGYRGLILLARQGGEVGAIDAGVVHEGDLFDYEMGLHPRLIHRKSKEPAYDKDDKDGRTLVRPIVAAWCAATVHGERQFTVLEWWEVERIRNGSQGYRAAMQYSSSSPWIDHPGAMATKTAVRAQMKLVPGSSERLAVAHALDDAHDAGERQRFDEEIAAAIPEALPARARTTGDLVSSGNDTRDAKPDPLANTCNKQHAAPACADPSCPHKAHSLVLRADGRQTCDGEHAEPRCTDAGCWLSEPPVGA